MLLPSNVNQTKMLLPSNVNQEDLASLVAARIFVQVWTQCKISGIEEPNFIVATFHW